MREIIGLNIIGMILFILNYILVYKELDVIKKKIIGIAIIIFLSVLVIGTNIVWSEYHSYNYKGDRYERICK